MSKYVCSGAKLKCSMGSRESELAVIRTQRVPVYIKDNLMATIMDNKPIVNVKSFGQCQSLANPIVAAATAANYGRLQKMPCVPNTSVPWFGGKPLVLVSDEQVILDNSKLMCMWAGVIEITNPGQDFVMDGTGFPKAIIGDKAVALLSGQAVESDELTVKDFAEILERIEKKKNSYEAARHYATYHVDYWKITKLAKRYVDETDEAKKENEKNNDPNLMPSRFMLLYGADDEKLRRQGNLDNHPDNFDGQPEHEISVVNLRRALRLLGYNVEDSGPFDQGLFTVFLLYLNRFSRVDINRVPQDDSDAEKPMERVANKYGAATWKYFYEQEGGDGEGNLDHDRIIKKFDNAYGDELIKEKDGDPRNYISSICYHYPWVPFRLTVNVGDGYEVTESATYEIRKRDNNVRLCGGSFREPYVIECLLPDTEVTVTVDNSPVLLCPECPTLIHKDEDNEPGIKEMYWSYKNDTGEYVKISDEDELARYYVSLNLHIKTANYKNGDLVTATIKSDYGQDGGPLHFEVNAIVHDNEAVVENLFQEYTSI